MAIITASVLMVVVVFRFVVTATPMEESLLSAALIALVSLPTLYLFSYVPVRTLLEKHRGATESAAKLQSRLMRLAFHDSLTRLPNKRLFEDLLDEEIRRLAGPNDAFSVLLIKIGHLSEVNDVLGYEAGNDVIVELAKRLKKTAVPPDLVARIGGNEFAVLVASERYAQTRDTIQVAVNSMESPIQVEGTTVNVAFSIGYVSCPFHGKTKEHLLRHVDVAMRQARAEDRPYASYDRAKDPYSRRKLMLFSGLKEAVYNDRGLSLCYQPKANFQSMKLDSVEALARWEHSGLGGVSPAEFIPIAESSGLIRQLTYRVLEHSLRQIRVWFESGVALKTAINLSAKDIQDSKLVDIITALLEQSGIPPTLLEVEITESAFMNNTERTIKNICRLKELGITVTIDDFGTGYSSLAYLSKLPIDTIKIDKAFVTDIRNNRDNRVIVKTCIDLAHNLGMKTVAEGVESRSDFDLLRDHGCDYIQGYLIGKPMDSAALLVCVNQFDNGHGELTSPELVSSESDVGLIVGSRGFPR